MQAEEAVEKVAHLSYGKLVAVLAASTRDIAAAEDALSAALLGALEEWPRSGVPRSPEAWLLSVARRKAVDLWRRRGAADRHADAIEPFAMGAEHEGRTDYPDERLKLLFVCAHPEIEPRLQAPLMLQCVLGVDARRIASALLIAPATLGQRLSRAKARIRDLGLRFEVPELADIKDRMEPVLDAIYLCATLDGGVALGEEHAGDLAQEAIWLGGLMVELMPERPEPKALLALMFFVEARRAARRPAGMQVFVPLDRQDTQLWDEALCRRAESLLREAGRSGMFDRFGLEAAIQAVHADRRRSGRTDWAAVVHLYDGLLRLSPTLGAFIGRAVALCEAEGPGPGLAALQGVPQTKVSEHQPYWAAMAHLSAAAGDAQAALTAFDRAIGLTADAAVRAFLLERRAALLQS